MVLKSLEVELTTTKQYERSPWVVEYAKRRAKGICQLCRNLAPFKNSKGEPYLETHHIIWLAESGEDTIENTVALCPNCHRKMHIVKYRREENFDGENIMNKRFYQRLYWDRSKHIMHRNYTNSFNV